MVDRDINIDIRADDETRQALRQRLLETAGSGPEPPPPDTP